MFEIRLRSLPMDGRVWRVEWIGELRPYLSTTREMEIDVAFRRMRASGKTYLPTLMVEIFRVGASEVCGLPLGSLWSAGVFVAAPQFDEHKLEVRFPRNTAYRPTVFSIPLTSSADSSRVGEFGDFVLPVGMGSSRYFQGEAKIDGVKMPFYVPLFEVARAWYLRDSELTRRILARPMHSAVENLIDIAGSRSSNGNCEIRLREGLPASAVPVAAMLAFDHFAQQAASRIIAAYASGSALGRARYLEAMPPIHGSRRLSARGAVLPIKKGKAFFAYVLTSVPFPHFESIEWTRESSSSNSSTRRVPVSDTEERSDEKTSSAPMATSVEVHSGRESFGRPVNSVLALQSVFADLPPIRRLPEQDDAEAVLKNHTDGNPPPSSETTNSREVVSGVGEQIKKGLPALKLIPKALPEHEGRLLPASFENFFSVVSLLEAFEKVETELVKGSEFVVDEQARKLTLMNYLSPWAHVRRRPRQVAVALIKVADRHFYFFEIERRNRKEEIASCLVWRREFKRFFPTDIDRILMRLAVTRGSWSSIHEPFGREAIAHKFVSTKNFSRWIFRFIQNLPERGNETTKSGES